MLEKIIASLFFVGYFPFAQGTMASLVTITFFSIAQPSVLVHLIIVFMSLIAGLWASQRCESFWGKDNKKIVVDEFVGQAIALIAIPVNMTNFLLSFIFFRFFDIVKPPPIRNFEKSLKGGMGVMFDDVAAGIFANICTNIILFL